MKDPKGDTAYYDDGEEITLKDLILKIQEFWNVLWSNKLKLALAVLIFGSLNYALNSRKTIKYTSAIVFLVSEEDINRSSTNFNARASRLELQRSNSKITELARSGRIMNKVMLSKVIIDEKKDFIANHIIREYNFHTKWLKGPKNPQQNSLSLTDFFFASDNYSQFSEKEIRALRQIRQVVSGNNLTNKRGLMSITYDEETDIFMLEITAKHSELASVLMSEIYKGLQEFYIIEAVGRPRKTYDLVKNDSDSLNILLTQKSRQLAVATDRNKNVFGSTGTLNIQNLKREVDRVEQEYNNTYKLVKELEYVLTKDTPEFIEIERTYAPIAKGSSMLLTLLVGGFFGGFLYSGYLILRKIVRDALAS